MEQMEVEKNMCDALNELFADELKEADAIGEARGHKNGILLAKQVFRLSALGKSEQEIAEQCETSVEQVREILD